MNDILSFDTIKSAVASLGEEYGADKIWLFGSYARNEATVNSDVDIVMNIGSIRGLAMMSFIDKLETRLGKSVDYVNDKYLSESFRSRIEKDKVLLYDSKAIAR